MHLRSHRDVSCGDQLLYLSMGCEPHIWRLGHFWGILERFLPYPVSVGGSQQARGESSNWTRRPGCWALKAGFMPDIARIVA